MTALTRGVAEGAARFGEVGAEVPGYVLGSEVFDLRNLCDDINPDFLSAGGLSRAREAARQGDLPVLNVASAARVGPPVVGTRSLVCVGLNYRDHARETGQEPPEEPILFFKATNTIVGANDAVVIPPGSTKTDWEVELAIVVGRRCWRLPDEAAAAEAIAGYSISNDVSEREYQLERGGQWVKGKSCPTFNPLGPALVPADANDPSTLALRLSVNGEDQQRSSTSEMIFGPAYLVWYISQFLQLEPGDIINSGTPHGVGLGQQPPRYLDAGDVIEVEIEGLGTQRSTVSS